MKARSAFSSSLSSREALRAGTATSEALRDSRPVPPAAAADAGCCCASADAAAAAATAETAATTPLGSWIRRRLAAGPPLGLRLSTSPLTAAAAAAATPAARAACAWLPPWWLPSQSCRPNRSAGRGTGSWRGVVRQAISQLRGAVALASSCIPSMCRCAKSVRTGNREHHLTCQHPSKDILCAPQADDAIVHARHSHALAEGARHDGGLGGLRPRAEDAQAAVALGCRQAKGRRAGRYGRGLGSGRVV